MQGLQRSIVNAITDMIGFGWACTDDVGWQLIMIGLGVQSSSLLSKVEIPISH